MTPSPARPLRPRHTSRALTIASLLTLLATPLAAWTPRAALADDLERARERWQTCQDLYKKGDPCAALRACEEGLAARSTRSLEELTTAARAACDHAAAPPKTKPSRDPDRDGILAPQDLCPQSAEDFDGFQDADGCPDPDNDNDGLPDLLDQCPLSPEDLDRFQDDDGCPDPDNDADGIPDARDQCPNDPEDADSFQDADGCPDPDNDADNLLDAQDQCPNAPEDPDGFQDDDGCPDPDNDSDGVPDTLDQCPNAPEDRDSFQDDDGCPDPDNDSDGVLDALDRCPNDPEDLDGDADDDGCPDDNLSATAITGWSLLGVGVAAAGAGVGLHLSAESKRDQVRDPTTDAVGTITSVTMAEAQALQGDANTLDAAALITSALGGALTLTGATLLLIDLFSTPSAPPPPVTLTPSLLPDGASLLLQGRF